MTQDAKWQLVSSRDPDGDGKFFYGVRTTGIYCRPSCPSRRPKRESVEFFVSRSDAERAGYRACRRCTPGEISSQMRFVRAACVHIDQNKDQSITLNALGEKVGVSGYYLQRLFKKFLGISPREYQETQRFKHFKEQLAEGRKLTDAVYEAGFGSSSRVYEKSDLQLGMTPAKYQRLGQGTSITYTIIDSFLGKVLIAATAKGICSIRFGNAESSLERKLRSEFQAASIRRDDHGLNGFADAIKQTLGGSRTNLDLPLDVQATAFQRRVWNVLKKIPRGKTQSYSQIASEIGSPNAVRAVASACRSNPVAIVIPCHRVLHKNGGLAGYRWGVQRKKRLLGLEQKEIMSR